jgi:6-pyruvoyltetrahydropterin/6-carboxytetrahydropterin synthase
MNHATVTLPIVRVSRRLSFCCAHFYYKPQWSEAENLAAFHACSNRFGHGHNYDLYLYVEGPVDPETGMVVNLSDLKALLKQELLTRLDHKHLNHQVPFFKHRIPTMEHLAYYCWHRMKAGVEALGLKQVMMELHENEDLSLCYKGEPLPGVDPQAVFESV